jgi:hypothetical protein
MTDSFSYRPKFVDIRVRKPPMHKVDPEIQTCEHDGCEAEAKCRAPKSRDNPGEIWHFCEKHAAAYNKNWNFFDGMTNADMDAFKEGELNGHRPTWKFKEGGNTPEGQRFKAASTAARGSASAPLGRKGRASEVDTTEHVPSHVRKALSELEVELTATPAQVRAAYAGLVRKFHPDSNGGDRSAEARLNAVVKAYKVLKTARRG